MRLLFDTCILLDFLLKRQPFADESYKLVLDAASYKINGYVTAKSLTDIYYITKKYYHNNKEAKQTIQKLMELFNTIDTTKVDCKNALLSNNYDFDDAVMIESAVASEIDYIVTRNLHDYENSPIKVLTPSQVIALYKNN